MTDALDGGLNSEMTTAAEDADQVVIARCLAGEPQAYRILYRRYQAKVRSTLYQLCDPEALDDLVQEVFLKAWKGLPKFRQQAQFSTWLYRIAWNVASDYRQRQIHQRTQLETLQQAFDSASATTDVMQLHYQDLIQRGLQSLSLDHRAVLVLHDLEQLPQKQIAEILAIPRGTVKSRLFHARAALRQFLEQEGVQP